jgi:hypothetical protein
MNRQAQQKAKKTGTDRASDKQEPEIMLTSLAVQPEDSTAVIRPLGSLEQLFYLLNQVSPTHFAVAAEIKGRTTIAIVFDRKNYPEAPGAGYVTTLAC